MHEISQSRLTTYLESLDDDLPEYLEAIRKKAEENDVPIIRRSMHGLIKTMLAIKQPKNILEIGTAVGFSTLFFLNYTERFTKILTIESYEPRIEEAKRNFEQYDLEKRISLLEGDANIVLSGIKQDKNRYEGFDFVFMDAAKGQYHAFLTQVLPLMKSGAILLTDNVFQDGDIIESKYTVRRRDRTIHSRMRDFLYEITHHEELTTTIIPLGDGAAVSVKK